MSDAMAAITSDEVKTAAMAAGIGLAASTAVTLALSLWQPPSGAEQVAVMRSVLSDKDVAKMFGALGVEQPVLRIEASRIYDALLEGGQQEKVATTKKR